MIDIERVTLGHINLRGNAADSRFAESVESALGQPLPMAANTFSQAAHRVYWLGPDEWQIATDFDERNELLNALEHELQGQHVSFNDLSGGLIAVRLSGAEAARELAKGCTLDLDPSVFQVGDCAQSGLAKASMLLGCIDRAPVYEIIVRRSFSEYVLRWFGQT